MSPEIKVAIIASSSAILGALISQITTIVISWVDKRRQKQVLLRQKYEEVMIYFSDSLEWIVHLNGSTNQESVFSLAQSPSARKALSLCLLYFRKDLGSAANDYILAQQTYYQSLIKVYDKNDLNCTAGGQFWVKEPKCKEITDNLFQKKNDFENLIISNASQYTKV